MKFRLFLVSLILILDAVILPKLVFVLMMIIKGAPPELAMKTGWIFFWNVIGEDYAPGYYICQIAVAGLIFVLLWKEEKGISYKISNGIGGPPAAGKGQFGTARWQSEKEFDSINSVWKLDGSTLNQGGLVLGADLEKKKAWVVVEDEHTLLIGTTGSGKTRRNIYPSIVNLAEAGESLLLTDPKGELYEMTKSYLENKGYEVVMLDFRTPRQSTHHWNPMKPVVDAINEGDESRASEMAWNIAHMIVHQKPHNGDPIWSNGQESVIAALILYVAKESKNENEKHLASVYQLIVEYTQIKKRVVFGMVEEYVPLNELINELPNGHLAKSAFATAGIAPEKMRGSFFSSVAADLRLFSDPGVAYLTSFQDHNFTDLGKKKTATFLIIPDEVKTRHFLAALYIDQAYLQNVEYANSNGGRVKNRINCLLDEFGNMPKITDFDTKITVSRSRGIRYTLVIQGLDQLKEKYDKTANTISGNCRVWIYLLTGDYETAKVISNKLGKYTIANQSYSSSAKVYDVSASHSQNLTGRDLLTPDEIMRFPDNQGIILRTRQYPGKIPTPDISKYPVTFKKIERGDYQKTDMSYRVFDPFGQNNQNQISLEKEQMEEVVEEKGEELSALEMPVDYEETYYDLEQETIDSIDVTEFMETPFIPQEEVEEVEVPEVDMEEMEEFHFDEIEVEKEKKSYMDLI